MQAPKHRRSSKMKQTRMKQTREALSSAGIFADVNTPPLMMGMTYSLKVNKDTEDINHPADQLNVTGTYKTLSLKAAEGTVSSVH